MAVAASALCRPVEVGVSVTAAPAVPYDPHMALTLSGVLVFGFLMIVVCSVGFAFQVARGPRRRPGALMSLAIVVVVLWRLSDHLH
jgi:hypothetical protein